MKVRQPSIDILEINKLRRQILFHSYVWDQRLIHAAGLIYTKLQEGLSNSIPKLKGSVSSMEKLVDTNINSKPSKGFSSCDSFLQEARPDPDLNQGRNICDVNESIKVPAEKDDQELNHRKEAELGLSPATNSNDKFDTLESGKVVRRALSEGEFPVLSNLSDTLDAAWTGESHPANLTARENGYSPSDSMPLETPSVVNSVKANLELEHCTIDQGGTEVASSSTSVSSNKGPDDPENSTRMAIPFSNFTTSFSRNSLFSAQKLGISEYNPVYVPSFRELEQQSGARLLLPVGVDDTIVPVYDDEPTSIIAYALISSDYYVQMSESEKPKDAVDSAASLSLLDSVNLLSLNSFDDASSDTYRSLGSSDETILSTSGSRGSQVLDPLLYTKDLHARVSFTDDCPLGKVKYTVTCYYAKRFEALRRICCPSELDFIRSLSRCKKWGAQGGKSNVFFAKTLDDRFIIKQVTKTELESFIKFGPAYFKYLSESISTKSPTCLAKILGIYQVCLLFSIMGELTLSFTNNLILA